MNQTTKERIALAKELGEKMGRTFVAATFKILASQDFVKITIPGATAKYLKPVKDHQLLVFEDETLQRVIPIDISAHSIHGDFPIKREDGSQRPRVIRHFYVLPGYYGETIAACVTIKEKTDLINGEKTIILDIQQEFAEKKIADNDEEKNKPDEEEKIQPLVATHKLVMGAPVTGSDNEVLIPGTDNLCIKFEAIHPFQIAIENCDADLLEAATSKKGDLAEATA